ncbi:uncharacterized protein F4807DRAFT_454091 [Annulohypoxylon truncatum]|uniref:uncharacterized protein n=1 Tax=Annulohypoxylon truncatum TaxID=327061 RepID=UPI002007394B|nr:uncharacterized protein F4807DRAFT_454091 [Annulohypoxylon truncatum]KAI1205357.1 hypothetical protein F4807DRAFT_454091 [Annulohypoxylon truncatum]
MATLRRVSKRRSRKLDLPETSSTCPDTLVSRNREPLSLYKRQLASPPASSGCTIPASSSDVESCHHGVSESPMKDDGETPNFRNLRLSEPSADSKHLTLSEKVKLLKICCNYGSRFLHCPTSGKHAEEEVWTPIMEEFSTTVRSGVFTKYSDVRKVASKTCRNRRKNTKENVPPQRRSRMGDLDTWIDRWVRIWKCRDLVVNIANAHQSMRETLGEKKFKRIFHHRMDGNEMPQDLGRLTLTPPLWKAIQKRIRTEERSLGSRHVSLFPGEDESDWTDEEETEDDTMEEADDEGPPIKSIEEEFQNSSSEAPEGIVTTPNREADMELEFPDPTPRTQARLDEFERGYATVLKEEQGRTGKQLSVTGLAHKRHEEEQQASASSSRLEEALAGGATQPQLEEKGPTTPKFLALASNSGEVEDKERDGSTGLFVERSTPVPGAADVQRSAGTSASRFQRLEPGTYCPNKDVQPANDEPQRQGDKVITPSSSHSKKRGRCQSIKNLSSNSLSDPCKGSFRPPTAPKALCVITSASNEHFAKRQRPLAPSGHVQTPVPAPDLTKYGLKPFWRPSTKPAGQSNDVPEKHGHPSVGPLEKGKGKAIQPHTQNKHFASDLRSSNGNGYTSKWKTGAKNITPSHRFNPYGQPGGSSGPATSQNRRKNSGRGKRDRYRGKDHHDRAGGGSHSINRFMREVTTDTVDFENFSPERKWDFLHREISRMKETLRKIDRD